MVNKQKYGSWRVEKRIKSGCHGICYLAKRDAPNEPQDKRYCLKIPSSGHLPRFKYEVQALDQLDHRNILPLVDYSLDMPNPYMVTPFYEGGTLEDVDLSDYSYGAKYELYSQICSAVAYCLQKGIKKSDHKLENIFLTSDDKERPRPVIGDFGMAREIHSYKDTAKEMEAVTRVFHQLFEGKNYMEEYANRIKEQRASQN